MTQKAIALIFFFAMLQWHCVQTYVSPYKSPAAGYLVVEGYIAGNGPTYFRLSRSVPLSGDSAIPAVTGAQLTVEGSDNSIYPFTETGNGYYLLPAITMNTATRYRLRITNVNNESYLSDFVPFKPTPPIDSVKWISNSLGVSIYVNTHDPTGNTRYYQWKYNETWEYTSSGQSGYEWRNDSLLYRPPEDQIYFCYHTDSSSLILIGSSAKLAQDLIDQKSLLSIPVNTWALGIEYSVLVSQYALTDSAYNYLSLVSANTEQLGTIFDAQPTQTTGNIHCLNNPGEPVVGYISAGTLQQQRIFISARQVPDWFYYYRCDIPDTIFPESQAAMMHFFDDEGYIPISTGQGKVIANVTSCVDCRVQGGTTQKPDYWPF